MGSTTFVIPSVFTAVDKFSAPVKAMGGAIQGFVGRSERLLGRANAAFSRLISPLTHINRLMMGMGVYVGLYTFIRIIRGALDIFADFQQANVDLAIVMGVGVKQNKILADEARKIGLAYGVSATEVVKMQHALATLGFEQSDIMKMGRPMITGASALEGADPERLADIIGATINSFDNLAVGDTQHILDVMALASARTALNFDKMATIFPIVNAPANAINVSFERMVALLGVLQNAGVHVSTSATALKNIFIDTKKKGGNGYIAFLEEVIKNVDKLTFANAKVGKRSVVSALNLAMHLNDGKNSVTALTTEFEKAENGLTQLMAVERLNTFRGAQKLLNATYQEFILSIEDGNGPLAESLMKYMKVASTVLLLSSNTDAAREALTKMDPKIIDTANSWLFWGKAILWISGLLITARIALFAWSVMVGITKAAMVAYNIVSGIMTALTMASSVSIVRGAQYMWGYRVALWAVTAAQWLFNAAMNTNPIILVITGVIGLLTVLDLLDSSFNKNTATFNKWADALKGVKGLENVQPVLYHRMEYAYNKAVIGEEYAKAQLVKGMMHYSDKERQEQTIVPIVNPKSGGQHEIDSIMNLLKGNINLNINDPGGHVKDIQSDSAWIQPIMSDTTSFTRR